MSELSAEEVLNAIHRQSDGRINFARKTPHKPRGWEPLASIQAGEIGTHWPQLAPFMEQDAYFSLSSFSKPSRATGPAGLPQASGRKPNVQYLNAQIVDIDCGRGGKNTAKSQIPEDAIFEVQEQCDKLGIQRPGLWALSGRGAYAIWPFENPLRQWPEILLAFEAAQRSLLRVHRASDPAGINANRVFRVPGTKHGISGNLCRYYQATPGGITRTDANELYEQLGIKERVRHWPVTQNPGSQPQKKAGFFGLHRKRVNDIVALHRGRNGLKKGTRLYGLTTYAVARLHCGDNECEVEKTVKAMAQNCEPPYPSDRNDLSISEVMTQAKQQVKEKRRATNGTIIKWLRIEREEMSRFKLQTLNTEVLERSELNREKRRDNERRPKRSTRRDFVEAYERENPTATAAQVHRAAEASGMVCSRDSIERDLRQMRL